MSTNTLLTMHLAGESINGTTNTGYTGVIDIHARIPKQTVILKTVRVEMTTTAEALAERIVYIDLPFLNSYCLKDGVSYMSRLPVALDNNVVTLKDVNVPLSLDSSIESKFRMSVYKRDGSLATNCSSCTLQISLSESQINR